MDHHRLSPSKFPAFNECPCYVGFETSSLYAEEGIKKHKQLYDCFNTCKKPEDEEVNFVYETITSILIKEFGNEYATIKMYPEEKIVVDDENLEELYFGTCDLIARTNKKAILFDAKFGQTRDYYLQMVAYARGIMERWGLDSLVCYEVYGKLGGYKNYTIEYKESVVLTNKIINSVNDTNRKSKKCNYCKWCANISTCEESTVMINALVDQVGQQIKGKHLVPINKDTSLTDPVEVGRLLDICRMVIKPWVNTIEFVAKNMADNGNVPVGYKYQYKRGNRKVNNILGLFDATNLSQTDFLNCCNVSLQHLKEKLKCAPKEFNKITDPFCVRGEGSKSLIQEKEEVEDEKE